MSGMLTKSVPVGAKRILSRRAARLWIGKSVIGKVVFAVVLTVALSSTVSLWLSLQSQRAALYGQFDERMAEITGLLANNVAGSIKFKLGKVIEENYSPLANEEDSSLEGLIAVTANGEVVNVHGKDVVEATGLRARTESVDASNLEQAIVAREDGHLLVISPAKTGKGEVAGLLGIAWSTDQLEEKLLSSRNQSLISMTVSVAFLIGMLLVLLISQVTRPLKRITSVLKGLAEGESDKQVPYRERRDEIGQISSALIVLQENEVERVRLNADTDKAREQQEQRQKHVEGLIQGFRASVRDVLEAVSSSTGHLGQAAENLNQMAESASSQATEVAAATEQAMANVTTIAGTTEELTTSISEISNQIDATQKIVDAAVSGAEESNAKVSGLATAVQKIGDVVLLIQDIAEQTNLLALNATIEAARAGEMGKGFAVVASEVKTLASQTGKATEEISQQIAGIQSSTDDTVASIAKIVGTMKKVNEYTTGVAGAIEEQGDATAEISRNAQEAATGTKQVTGNITEVSKSVGNTRESVHLVLDASRALTDKAQALQTAVDRFLTEVAAA